MAFWLAAGLVVESGTVAPWFGQYGGGIQYILPQTVQQLLDSGIISIYGGG